MESRYIRFARALRISDRSYTEATAAAVLHNVTVQRNVRQRGLRGPVAPAKPLEPHGAALLLQTTPPERLRLLYLYKCG